jgi:hypothetical protein
MLDYARIGAVARLTEIQSEIASIRAAFPDLAGAAPVSRRPQGRQRSGAVAAGKTPAPTAPFAPDQPAVRKRLKLSAKARKAISDAQKKRWAAYKANAKNPPDSRT